MFVIRVLLLQFMMDKRHHSATSRCETVQCVCMLRKIITEYTPKDALRRRGVFSRCGVADRQEG